MITDFITSRVKLFWWRIWFSTIDEYGYRRTNKGHLLHRKIAWNYIFLNASQDSYPFAFSRYVIHHVDRNKLNNNISNLRILTEEEHRVTHKK